MCGYRTRKGAAAAARLAAAVTLFALLRLAAPQATGRAAGGGLSLTRAETAYLQDPAVVGLRNPQLEPLAARAVSRFDAMPPTRAALAARRAGLTTARLRHVLATDAASLHLDTTSGALHYACSFGHNSTDSGDSPPPTPDLQPGAAGGGGLRRALQGLDSTAWPDQADPAASQAFLLHR
jgi:hypothetical protein